MFKNCQWCQGFPRIVALAFLFGIGLVARAQSIALLPQGQVPLSDSSAMLKVLFEPDSLTNLLFIQYSNCPLRYTNVITNTNLFRPEDAQLFRQALTKYKHVTTNSGPVGSVLVGVIRTNGYCEAHFSYPDTGAREGIIFGANRTEAPMRGRHYEDFIKRISKSPLARFRTMSGDGYDAILDGPDSNQDLIVCIAQIKHEKVNGLFVIFRNDHCETYLRCVNDSAIGEWYEWDVSRANTLLKIKIHTPLDYFKYMTQQIQN